MLDHLQQLAILVRHHVLGDLSELLLVLHLLRQLLLALSNDVVFVLLVFRHQLLLLNLCQTSQLSFPFGNVPLCIALVNKR